MASTLTLPSRSILSLSDGDLVADLVPVDLLLAVVLVGLDQIHLQLVADPLAQVLVPHLQLTQFKLGLMHLLFDLGLFGAALPQNLFGLFLLLVQPLDLRDAVAG